MPVMIAAHDISGVGRCSLTTALAVLPAMGHTCYPLPTAVLSQQTGLEGYSFLDLTSTLPGYISGWNALNLHPDMIYTGFLGNARQPQILAAFIREHIGARVVVDPVMGDNGGLYSCFDADYVKSMAALVKSAHILVPNVTEFNLLCGQAPEVTLPDEPGKLLALAERIDAPELRFIVITSAVLKGRPYNLLLQVRQRAVSFIPCRNNGVSYNGTGDLFASVLCGKLLSGQDIQDAICTAADFVAGCIETMPEGSDTRLGINYEPRLLKLAEGANANHGKS